MAEETSKSIFKSKRFWLNVATGVGGVVLEAANHHFASAPAGSPTALIMFAANVAARRYMPDQGEVHVVTPRPVEPTP